MTVATISKRMKEIASEEKPIQNANLDTAVNRDLEFIARDYGLYRQAGEGDYALTARIKKHKLDRGLA